jgi:putative membrane protein
VPIEKSLSPTSQFRLAIAKGFAKRAALSGVAALLLAAGPAPSSAQNDDASVALSPVDYNFVAQANLGAPFQIDSGRIAEKAATAADIRDYAHLMVVTHIPVVDSLNRILSNKNIEAPSNPLLSGAFNTMISSLNADSGAALDRDYVQGQVDYQKGNEALFRYEIENGSDEALKDFARATLPKIVDHRDRALKLAAAKTASK